MSRRLALEHLGRKYRHICLGGSLFCESSLAAYLSFDSGTRFAVQMQLFPHNRKSDSGLGCRDRRLKFNSQQTFQCFSNHLLITIGESSDFFNNQSTIKCKKFHANL